MLASYIIARGPLHNYVLCKYVITKCVTDGKIHNETKIFVYQIFVAVATLLCVTWLAILMHR